MEDVSKAALEWLYRELKRIKISLGHLESRSGCDKCRERQDLERKQSVAEHLIDLAMTDIRLDAALQDLKMMDVISDCEHCKHRSARPEWCDIMDCDCAKCDAECACRNCMRYDKWEWRGPQE